MNKVISITISLLLAGLIIVSMVGNSHKVYNPMYTSPIFSVSLVCCIIGVLYIFSQQSKNMKFSYSDIFILLFLLFYITKNPHRDALWDVGCLFLFLLFITIRTSGRIRYQYLYYGTVITLFILSAWGYLQHFEFLISSNSYFKITASYFNPGILGGVMGILLAIIIIGLPYMFAHIKRRRGMLFLISLVIVISLPVFILTSARAAWSAFFVSTLYGLFKMYKRRLFDKKRIVGLSFTIGVIFLLSFFYHLKPLSADGRLLIWKVSWQMIKDKPIVGFGKSGFEANYMYYQANYMEEKATESERYIADNTHFTFNEVVRIAVEHGFIGVMFFLLFIVVILWLPIKQNVVAITAKSVILSILVWGMFSYPNQVFIIMTILVVSCSILLSFQKRLLDGRIVLSRNFIHAIVILVIIPSTMLLQRNYDLYHRLYHCQQSSDIEKITTEIDYFLKKMPNDVGVLSLYAYVLQRHNQNEEHLEVIRKIADLHPNPSSLIQMGELLQKLNDPLGAECIYKQAAAMIPTRQKARYKLVLLYYQTGRKAAGANLAHILLTEKVKNYGFETYEMLEHLREFLNEDSDRF